MDFISISEEKKSDIDLFDIDSFIAEDISQFCVDIVELTIKESAFDYIHNKNK